MRYVLYNPLSTIQYKHEELEERIQKLDETKKIILMDITQTDVRSFLENLNEEDDLFLCGGDGTINKFINCFDHKRIENNFYLYKSGNGNNFLRDLDSLDKEYVLLNPYLKNLPVVNVNGQDYKFINGVGFGIDGMVCVESDKMKDHGEKDINYTSLSIKLLLTKFKKVNAHIDIDGTKYDFKNVFLASTMNGRYYVGGMKIAPDQDRTSEYMTLCVWHNFNRITALMAFPSIFKGEHIKKKKKVLVLKGKQIKVTFDRPTGLQIDGESFDGVLSYEAHK